MNERPKNNPEPDENDASATTESRVGHPPARLAHPVSDRRGGPALDARHVEEPAAPTASNEEAHRGHDDQRDEREEIASVELPDRVEKHRDHREDEEEQTEPGEETNEHDVPFDPKKPGTHSTVFSAQPGRSGHSWTTEIDDRAACPSVQSQCSPRAYSGLDFSRLREALRIAKDAAGLTYDELAERSGLSRSTITSINSGKRRGDLVTWDRLALAFDTDPLTLLAPALLPPDEPKGVHHVHR